MSIYNDILVQQIEANIFSVDGYPTDCVNIGLHSKLTDKKFDLIISGINKGVNMGEDTLYSGTFGLQDMGECTEFHHLPLVTVSLETSQSLTRLPRIALAL